MPWQDRHKVAIVYLAVGSVALIAYLVCTIFVYMGEKDFEKSVASIRSTTQTTTRVNTDVLEAGNPQSNVGGAAGAQAIRTTSSVADSDLVKLTRSKVLMSPEPREKVDQRTDGSAVFKRQLLY
ncbi:hypothetical protein IQ07DRAFT_674760 [Pyrenochaeta sp. DS3sAY3a]|nr:hypothetical protein IQ07DRAFT_674760 [Pyrenochaeta sp. DS3sAY3a]